MVRKGCGEEQKTALRCLARAVQLAAKGYSELRISDRVGILFALDPGGWA